MSQKEFAQIDSFNWFWQYTLLKCKYNLNFQVMNDWNPKDKEED